MRFMVMHKMTAEMEKGLPPDPEIIQGVGRLISEGTGQDVFISGEGLKPSSQRIHVVYRNGKRTVTEGPFADPKELLSGFCLMNVSSRDEALVWADKFAAVIGDVALTLGPVVEPWDIGMMPKPDNPPLRFMSLVMADAATEQDTPPSPAMMQKMGALIEEMAKAGAFISTGSVMSTRHGARILYKGGKRTIVDGPFTESKELIAGYAILELPSKQAAVEWADRFGEIVRVNEVEIRQMPG